MIIPWQSINEETLINVVQSVILREGTDYGNHELSLQDKTEKLLREIKSNKAVIFWSELHQTLDIKPNPNLPSNF